jgi:hypothetical protein
MFDFSLTKVCFRVASFSIGGLFLSPLHFMVASFFIGGLLLNPLYFRVASFLIGDLFLNPLHFWVASFSSEVFFLASYVLWLPLFSSDVFCLTPYVLGLPLFSSEVFLSQRARGLIVRIHSWLRCLSLVAFVEYGFSLASDFDVSYLIFWGIEAYIAALGYVDSTSLKTSHPHRLPLRGKVYGPQKSKCMFLSSTTIAHL